MTSPSVLLFLSFFLFFFHSCLSASPYYLQVSHQAPDISDSLLTFLIGGQPVTNFTRIDYGTGSSFIDVSDLVPASASVTITVVNQEGTQILSKTLVLAQALQCFYVVNLEDGSLSNVFYSWPAYSPSTATWFLFINLAPSQTGEVVVSVNGGALTEHLDYQVPSPVYKSGPAAYEFKFSNSSTTLATGSWILQPGTIQTVIVNGLDSTQYSVFKLIDWHTTYSYAQLRAVQSIPGQKAYVWLGGVQSWQGLEYKTVTSYEMVPTQTTDIYVSTSTTKPAKPTKTFTFATYGSYSLLITGNPQNDVPVQSPVITDASYAPIYTSYSLRVVYLSPEGSSVEVIVNGEDFGNVEPLGGATPYYVDEPASTDTNLTLVNRDFLYEDAIDAETLKKGSAFSEFVMGIYGDAKYDLDVIPGLDIASQPIVPLSDSTTNDAGDDDDNDDLSGGAIAGIVIGVLVGVALIVVLAMYIRRRVNKIPSQADYESVPTNNFL